MTDHKVEINDSSTTRDSVGGKSDEVWKSYEITSEAGLFINGTHYPKGESVELPYETAKNFASAGDIKGDFDENNV